MGHCWTAQGTAQFCGRFSTQIADDDTRMQRSGFCGIHTLVRRALAYGRG
jgi:hypothetical protein